HPEAGALHHRGRHLHLCDDRDAGILGRGDDQLGQVGALRARQSRRRGRLRHARRLPELGGPRPGHAAPAMMLAGKAQAAGRGRGAVLTIPPLGFWGGSHPALARYLVAKVLVMPHGRGSSSSSTVLAEAIRLATAPAAMVLAEPDPI